MSWVDQTAAWLRGMLRQPWLDAWQPTIERTPDWALLLITLGALMLAAFSLRLISSLLRASARAAEGMERRSAPYNADEPLLEFRTTEDRNPAPKTPTRTGTEPVQVTPPVHETAVAKSIAPVANSMSTRRSSGVPHDSDQERKARVFLSSTFQDMRLEREVLATETFPLLKRKFRLRGVEVQEVDLRWGVNEGDATIELCLQAVRRCNWFVGLIGQRYGTTLDDSSTVRRLSIDFPSIRDGVGRSLTELEILEGVLQPRGRKKEALFFERGEAWLDTLNAVERAAYEEQSPNARTKLTALKAGIREQVGAIHKYDSPQHINLVVSKALGQALEKAFPPLEGEDDPLVREQGLHATYARDRIGVYESGDAYISALNANLASHGAPQLVTGARGGGKSALLANWTQKWCAAHPNDIVLAHYLGASPASAMPAIIILRLWHLLQSVIKDNISPPDVNALPDALSAALFERLDQANAFAQREDCRIVIVLDGLDKLAERDRDLRWLPVSLPPRIKLLASSVDSGALPAARVRGWREVLVKPFDAAERNRFVTATLSNWSKSDLTEARRRRIGAHPLGGLPLFLKTVLEELRITASNEVLDARLDDYLAASDLPDLFTRMLAQIELECGKEFVSDALSLVWAGRTGLEEDEIVAIISEARGQPLGRVGLAWERLRNRLADNLLDVRGRVAFAHDYLRQAVDSTYLKDVDTRRKVHLAIAHRFEAHSTGARQAQELPYQLRAAEAWDQLEAYLIDLDRFVPSIKALGDAEILNYWMSLKDRGRDPEALLCGALGSRRDPAHWTKADIELANWVGAYLFGAGAPGDALTGLMEQNSDASERVLGAEDPLTLTVRNNLAAALQRQGDYQRAQNYAELVIKANARILGPDHPDTLSARQLLADILSDRGDLSAAQELAQDVVNARTRIQGDEHPQTLSALTHLASVLQKRGNLERAQDYQERVVKGRARIFGADHPRTLRALSSLASTLRERGDFDGAQTHYERIVAGTTRVLGPDHPTVLDAQQGLAATLLSRGNLEGALELLGTLFETSVRVLGPTHPSTLRTMSNAAEGLRLTGDLEGAQDLHEMALEANVQTLGPRHPDTLACMHNLAATLFARDDFASARKYQEEVLQRSMETLGDEHPATLSAMSNLAATLIFLDDVGSALSWLQRAYDVQIRLLGSSHPATQSSMVNLAVALRSHGDFERAQRHLEEALESAIQIFGPEHPQTLNTIGHLATTLAARNEFAGAQKLREQLLEVQTRTLGPEHGDTVSNILSLAEVLYAGGNTEAAIERAEEAHTVMSRHLDAEQTKDLADFIAAMKVEFAQEKNR